MTYFLLLPCWLVMELLGKTLWPILPLFAVDRFGWGNNGSEWTIEPRLPKWLAWFDTPDNSLWGDTGWRTIHCVDGWNKYKGMALWLLRNSSTGFSRSVLARTVYQSEISYTGDLNVTPDRPGILATLRVTAGKVWQYKKAFSIFGKIIGLNFGWQINSMITEKKFSDSCHYKVSIKIK